MATKIYELNYTWYEDYSPIFLEGPEVQDWKSHCLSLLPEAVKRAVEQESSWVGWQEVVEAMADLLCQSGYRRIKFEYFGCWGSCIIRGSDDGTTPLDAESLQLVMAHNEKIENESKP